MLTECLPQEPLDPVADDRVANSTRYGDANARFRQGRFQEKRQEVGREDLFAGALDPQVLGAFADPQALGKAVVGDRVTSLFGDDDDQLGATLAAAARQGLAASFGLHPLAESVSALATRIVGLECALHEGLLVPISAGGPFRGGQASIKFGGGVVKDRAEPVRSLLSQPLAGSMVDYVLR